MKSRVSEVSRPHPGRTREVGVPSGGLRGRGRAVIRLEMVRVGRGERRSRGRRVDLFFADLRHTCSEDRGGPVRETPWGDGLETGSWGGVGEGE